MWLFWCALGATTSRIKIHTHPSVSLFREFFYCSTKSTKCKWQLNTAENWQRDYDSVHFVARYSFLHCQGWPRQSMDETTMQYPLAANFTSRAGPCTGIVEPFKHLLCVTTHPQFLVLELWAPIGASPGQYGTRESLKVYFLVKWQLILDRLMLLLHDHKHASSFRMPENMASSNSIFSVMLYLHPHVILIQDLLSMKNS